MPLEAFDSLYDRNGTLCTCSGSHGNDYHNEESLETRAVLPTKMGASSNNFESLESSFFTTQHFFEVSEHYLRQALQRRNSVSEFCSHDKEARASINVFERLRFFEDIRMAQ